MRQCQWVRSRGCQQHVRDHATVCNCRKQHFVHTLSHGRRQTTECKPIMNPECVEIQVKGNAVKVPATEINGRRVVVSGKWLKLAVVQDEEVVEGEVVDDPEIFIGKLKSDELKADIFTFRQRFPDVSPRFKYSLEWDNLAIIPITSFDNWWKSLSQETRRNVRISGKRAVVVKAVEFDDEFVKGIKGIYDETPMRQGRRFWHYGKGFETLKKENGTYRERSEFIGAYYNNELIGFLKMIYVDQTASIMQILSRNDHCDKRSTNALIAKAVEICAEKGKSHLIYCKYAYGNEEDSSLAEFKRRNGFEKLLIPRYYVPLTAKGNLAIKFKLHRGIREVLPRSLLVLLLKLRTRYYEFKSRKNTKNATVAA